ncbi:MULTISPECIES: class I adenylate-forming enzyme family protein [unclassified Haematobacter]|uniref:class I adenylate-forming enzyme family protein n=1 Tax=unclassified Haematobacter TaxID=2640585 RepID=UPI0025C58D6B|nr:MULTISPECIES: AMP-binding protein [unclassified Haematobacter]
MHRFDVVDVTLPEIWASHARRDPDKPALVCDGQVLSWREFNSAMNRLANALIGAGVGKGDRVAVLVSSSIDACVAMFGTVKSGAVMVPVSGMLTSDQVLTLLSDCAAAFVIASADLRPLVDAIADRLPALRKDGRIGTDFDGGGWIKLGDFCAEAESAEPEVTLRGDDVFSIMYSSGTTGLPKGVVHTHAARVYFCLSNGFEMRFDGLARSLVTTALYTAGTWLVVMPTLFAGGTLHIHRQFRAEGFLHTLEAERITHTFTVPSQIHVILAGDGFAARDLSALKMMLSAGSPLRPDVKAHLIGLIGARFFELYGFTEGSSTLLRPEDQLRKPLSVGTPLMGQELAIVDGEGRQCGPDEPGEIVGRGPGLLREYHGKATETRAAIWRDAAGRTFIRSGDVGRLDAEGFLYILDRKKDMIISGGLNIYPTDLEAVVGTHPEVLDVTVVGIEHEKWGETPLAVVVLRDGARVSAEVLLDWANARLAKHQRLCRIDLRETLPRNALGKVLKRELRDEYRRTRPASGAAA